MYDKIVEACKSRKWDEASNWAIERARKQFDSFNDTDELNEFTVAVQHVKAVQLFDPMRATLRKRTKRWSAASAKLERGVSDAIAVR